MNVAFFYYDHFAEFEIALTWFTLAGKNKLIATALENRSYTSMEGQRFLIDMTLDELNTSEIDLLVIPGGNPTPLRNNHMLKQCIQKIIDNGSKVAGICGGSELLASCGFLDGRRCTGEATGVEKEDESYPFYNKATLSDEFVVIDGPFITAQGQAFAEFAVELGKITGNLQTDKDGNEWLRWLKNERSRS